MPTSLRFKFAAFEAELSSMKAISSSFLEASSQRTFDSLIANLRTIRTSGHGSWAIPEVDALRTRISSEYEKNGKAAHPIFGELSWIWDLTADKQKKKNAQPETFQVTGIASVRVQIKRHPDKAVLAEWRAELGAVDSPGCYFHSHINNQVCVPRVPTLFVTPMDTLEFVLGELFQQTWPEHVTSESHDVVYWRSKQSKLLCEVLEWKRRKVGATTGSPWVALKQAKPEEIDRLFSSLR